ncbi:YfiR family protein [Oxalobacteraceae sp. CFBP 13730]|nr:YfiR family protein [Oxalobacteraceae sp. CFBP 13730]
MTNNQPDCPQRRKVCRVLMLPLLAGLGMPVHAVGIDTAPALERRVKAAFLYKFLGYADFPAGSFADASTPVSIGVVGADDMAAELTRIAAGRLVTGRMITVRALREQDLAQPLHVLFVAGQDDARAARLLRAANAQLTVTECEGGLRSGSVINFTIIDDRVRFDVSLDAAEKKNVKLSSRLLTVANRVQKGAS